MDKCWTSNFSSFMCVWLVYMISFVLGYLYMYELELELSLQTFSSLELKLK